MTIAVLVLLVVLVLFGSVVLFGAPYLPTLGPQVRTAFELLDLDKGQTLLELGCGDGKVLIAAAERGHKAIGIELNPLLAFIAWARTRRYGKNVRVICANYWRMPWPPADAVYVFLLDRFMPRLDTRMCEYGGKLASNTFRVPRKKPVAEANGVFVYDYR